MERGWLSEKYFLRAKEAATAGLLLKSKLQIIHYLKSRQILCFGKEISNDVNFAIWDAEIKKLTPVFLSTKKLKLNLFCHKNGFTKTRDFPVSLSAPIIYFYLDRAPKFARPNGAQINSTNFPRNRKRAAASRGAWPHYYLCVWGSRWFGPARDERALEQKGHTKPPDDLCAKRLSLQRGESSFLFAADYRPPVEANERASARERVSIFVRWSGTNWRLWAPPPHPPRRNPCCGCVRQFLERPKLQDLRFFFFSLH